MGIFHGNPRMSHGYHDAETGYCSSIHQCHSVMRNKTGGLQPTMGIAMGSSRAMSAPLKTIEFHDFPSYPLVNVYITVENHHLLWVNQLFRLGHFQ